MHARCFKNRIDRKRSHYTSPACPACPMVFSACAMHNYTIVHTNMQDELVLSACMDGNFRLYPHKNAGQKSMHERETPKQWWNICISQMLITIIIWNHVLHNNFVTLEADTCRINSLQYYNIYSLVTVSYAVQLKQLATDYSQQKHTTWVVRGRIIIAQSKANYLSCTAPVVPPLSSRQEMLSGLNHDNYHALDETGVFGATCRHDRKELLSPVYTTNNPGRIRVRFFWVVGWVKACPH